MEPKFEGFSAPNTTPVPDELFDQLMPDLSGAELKVLLYICRRTFGFKRRTDAISLSQMIEGLTRRDGTQLDRGAGVSRRSLLGALESLEERGAIIRMRRRSEEKGDEPTLYALRFREGEVLPGEDDDPEGEYEEDGNETPRGAKIAPRGDAESAHPLVQELHHPRGAKIAPPRGAKIARSQIPCSLTVLRDTEEQQQQQEPDGGVQKLHKGRRATPPKDVVVVVPNLISNDQRPTALHALQDAGLDPTTANHLASLKDPATILLWCELAASRRREQAISSTAGFLRRALESDWVLPEEFLAQRERQNQVAREVERTKTAQEAEAELEARRREYWAALPEIEQEALLSEAEQMVRERHPAIPPGVREVEAEAVRLMEGRAAAVQPQSELGLTENDER